ncbi:MAG: hypothetical protein ACO2O5_06425 [Candidatus Caldipriscus sp.]|jgi:modification methylase
MKGLEKFINQVIHGDALEDSIDLGITSPPYNKKEKYGGWLVDKRRKEAPFSTITKCAMKTGK